MEHRNPGGLFPKYRMAVAAAKDISDFALRIEQQGPIEIQYAPFDYVQMGARLIIVGMTPGAQQANLALTAAKESIRLGLSTEDILQRAKVHASFGGPMRENLVEILDYLEVNHAISIDSTRSLWIDNGDLVHFTSAIRYPAFVNCKNYAGASPRIDTNPVITRYLETYLAYELNLLPNAMIIPFGAAAQKACAYLCEGNKLERRRVISGVPHPSPNNRQLIDWYLEKVARRDVSARVKSPEKVADDRKHAQSLVKHWRMSLQTTPA